jgi:hypothetical protein
LYRVTDSRSAVLCYGQQVCCTALWTAGLLYCVKDSGPSRQHNELDISNSKELIDEAGVGRSETENRNKILIMTEVQTVVNGETVRV